MAIRQHVTISEAGRVEVRDPGLEPGMAVEVIVMLEREQAAAEEQAEQERLAALDRIFAIADRIRSQLTPGPVRFSREELHERR